jgi:AcrR family transcriptional regulator
MPRTLSDQEIADFRDRVCDVGERLFAEHGPDAVTIRQLAAELGVSAMTPYRYFKDKDAILAAVRARAFDRFAQAMEEAESQIDPERYSYPGEAYVEWALGHPAAYKLMFDVHQPTFVDYPELLKAMERARATMSAGMQNEPRLRGQDIPLLAHTFWAAMHGPIMLELAGLLYPPLDARTLVRTTIERLMQGLKLSLD